MKKNVDNSVSKYIKRMYRGSVTVEAVFIVPLVLMITLTLIYAVLISHDRGIIYMELDRYAEEICFSSDPLPDNEVIDASKLNDRLLVYSVETAAGKKEGNSYHVTAYGDCRIKKLLVFEGLRKLTDYQVDFTRKKYNNCKKARKELKIIE